ncbi:Csu type fimbrial protein [Sulfurospirillum sp. 1612]|uniref:Csu type fimbrial protein n=1 Tax=Sulfurospirillum sp. 1612 TaxID=3094835 RepID=UPI002F920AA4
MNQIPRYIKVGLLTFCLLTQPAWALLASCTVSSTPVNFGNYDVFNSSPTDATGTVTVTCTGILGLLGLLVHYNVSLDSGNSGNSSARKMQQAGSSTDLEYNLYTDSGHSVVWGDGSNGSSTISSSLTILQLGANTDNISLYGRIPAGQNVEAGSYSDIITVTVDY